MRVLIALEESMRRHEYVLLIIEDDMTFKWDFEDLQESGVFRKVWVDLRFKGLQESMRTYE